MRKAEEILLEHIPRLPDYVKPNLIKAINEARKEAIEECAKRAETDGYCESGDSHCIVDEKSILSLINDLK